MAGQSALFKKGGILTNLQYNYLVILTILSLTAIGVSIYSFGILISRINLRNLGALFIVISGLLSLLLSFSLNHISIEETLPLNLLQTENIIPIKENFFKLSILALQASSISIVLGSIAFFALRTRTKHLGLDFMILALSIFSLALHYSSYEHLKTFIKSMSLA